MDEYTILMVVPAIFENGKRVKFKDLEEKQNYINGVLSSGKYFLQYKYSENGNIAKVNIKPMNIAPEKSVITSEQPVIVTDNSKGNGIKSPADFFRWVRTSPLYFRIPIALGVGILAALICVGIFRLTIRILNPTPNVADQPVGQKAVGSNNSNKSDNFYDQVSENINTFKDFTMQDDGGYDQRQNVQVSDPFQALLVERGYTPVEFQDMVNWSNGTGDMTRLNNAYGICTCASKPEEMQTLAQIVNTANVDALNTLNSLVLGIKPISNNEVLLSYAYNFKNASDAEQSISGGIQIFGSMINQMTGVEWSRCNYGMFKDKTSVVCDTVMNGTKVVYCMYKSGNTVYFFMSSAVEDNHISIEHLNELCNSLGLATPYEVLNGQ